MKTLQAMFAALLLGLFSTGAVWAETPAADEQYMTHGEVAVMLVKHLGGTATSNPAEAMAWLINRNIVPYFGWGYAAPPGEGAKPDPSVLCTQADLAVLLAKSMGLESKMDPSKDPAVAALEVLADEGIFLDSGGEQAIGQVNPLPGGGNLNDQVGNSDPLKRTDNSHPNDGDADGSDGNLPPPLSGDVQPFQPVPAPVIEQFFDPPPSNDPPPVS